MGNLIYTIANKQDINWLLYNLRNEVKTLQRKNRKLLGAIRKNSLEYTEEYKEEFIDDIVRLNLGDIVELTCTKEEYKTDYNDTYCWPYTLNRNYKALVQYKSSIYSHNCTVTLLFLDFLTINTRRYHKLPSLEETIDVCNMDLEEGGYKIRVLYKANQDDMEIEK